MIGNPHRKFYLFVLLNGALLLLTSSYVLSAQAGLGTAGAHVATEEFSFSYSVGQIFNVAMNQSDYYVTQGIQHARLMVFSDSPRDTEQSSVMKVYPNPVAHELHITLPHTGSSGCLLRLFNMEGQLLIEKFADSGHVVLSLEALDDGLYLFNILPGNSDPRTFKIIKTK